MYGLLLALPLSCCFSPAEAIVPDGDSHSGKTIQTPLPSAMRLENKTGMGLGLCVFTSINNSALYQDVKALKGFRDWMTKRQGGGYPEKVDAMIAQYCREQGVTAPGYVQHTGGDVAFLEKALKTGRMPGVTYNGRDGVHYRGPIAHMVNIVFLDGTDAAILDNNFPHEVLWMSRQEFLERWRGQGGGWAVVLTDPPPPPKPRRKLIMDMQAQQPFIIEQWGSRCSSGRCSGGMCPTTVPYNPVYVPEVSYTWTSAGNYHYLYNGSHFIGTLHPDGSYYEWPNGQPVRKDPPIASPYLQKPAGEEHWKTHGVDEQRLSSGDQYIRNGRKCSRQEALDAVGGDLIDDSAKGYISIIGDDAFQKTVLAAFDQPALAKWKSGCHLKGFAPDAWQVKDLGLSKGLLYEGPRQADGTADVLGLLTDFTSADDLAKKLAAFDNPAPVKPDPAPPGPNSPLREDDPVWPYVVAIGAVVLLSNSKRNSQ